MSNSDINAYIDVNSSAVFEIQHICSDTVNNIGFGKATGFDTDEVYTSINIQKIF